MARSSRSVWTTPIRRLLSQIDYSNPHEFRKRLILTGTTIGILAGVDSTDKSLSYALDESQKFLPTFTGLEPLPPGSQVIDSFGSAGPDRPRLFAHFVNLGIDLSAPEGTKVYAVLPGVVETAAYNSDLGNFIVVVHSGGYRTVYGHLGAIAAKIGQNVDQGAILGYVGRTGLITQAALHFAIVKDSSIYIDPEPLLKPLVKK